MDLGDGRWRVEATGGEDVKIVKRIAKPGTVWACAACGKRHRDRYGIQGKGNPGWDESCALNAVLCWDKPSPLAEVPREQWAQHTEDPAAEEGK